MSALKLNNDHFIPRAAKIYEAWENQNDENLSKANALVFLVGASEDTEYSKSNSLQVWLYNCHLADTLMIMTKKGIYFLGSSKKAQYFAPVESDEPNGNVPPFTILNRDKSDKDKANFDRLIDVLKNSGTVYGQFAKDKHDSEFAKAWKSALNEANLGHEFVDISASFSQIFATKLDKEIEMMKKAGEASAAAWNHLKKKIVSVIDLEKKMRHNRLSEEIEKEMISTQVQGGLHQPGYLEPCYTPIIQSGGQYALKFSTESNDKLLHYGTVISSLGIRYQSYCANISRTLMVEPSNELEEAYEILLEAELAVIDALKPGRLISDAYQAGIDFINEKKPSLMQYLVKNSFGFATGLEFREGSLLINDKCKVVVKPYMTFVISMGLQNFPNKKAKDEQGKIAAVFLSDTILVNEEGSNTILTEKGKSRLKSNVIRFKKDGEEKPKEVEEITTGRSKRSVVLQEQTRHKITSEDKRKERQKELADELNQRARERLSFQPGASGSRSVKKSNISYKSREKFPDDENEVKNLMIYVDKRQDSIIVPIFGVPVPFHISMIKNTSMSVEGDFTYLRINFQHPGSNIGKDNIYFPNPLATFLKELTFRASNVKEHGESIPPAANLSTAFRLIKEMQKKFRTQEAEEREKEGAVKQDKLILSTNKANPKLKDLYVRPNIIAKRVSGTLEAHVNGFRYTSLRGDKIDVLFNNIKHAIFQPCDNEMIILLHFHLKNPVLWGKKKYIDIQFYTEVGEITTDLNKYHHMQDRDDVQSEQMEREMRKKLNAAFSNFCDKVLRQTNEQIDFETPFNELAFFGVPFRSSCKLKPTSSCLINLTEWPPLIISLEEVELVHFERVGFAIKNFDMVFVFKDYQRKTQMIQSIPNTSLDSIKEWLNSCDIRYTEGIQSLNWVNIMKTITSDPDAFFENGGWNFLNTSSDEENDENDDESEEEAYQPSDEESAEEESDEDEDEESGELTESESGSDASLDSDESEGKDWSDLEEEAAKADKRKAMEEIDDDRKRKHKPSSKGPPPKKRK